MTPTIFLLPPALLVRLKARAAEEKLSMGALLRRLVEGYLNLRD